MGTTVAFALLGLFVLLGLGGTIYVFATAEGASKKRLQAIGRPTATGAGARGTGEVQQHRRRNVQAMLKDIEKQQAAQEKNKRPSLRRKLERAGLSIEPRTFWIICGIAVFVSMAICLLTGRSPLVILLVALAIGLGLPQWVLSFMIKRRVKAFTREFANAIDVIVRSVKSGLPTTEALKIVAREVPNPVGPEFNTLTEGLKVGVTLEQGLKKMYENMPTAEVGFFGIVMTIQQKSGGNLSEALSNLSGLLRDRKRLEGKIKAMSSEAKASAMIIGALPPIVMFLVYMSSPDYIRMLFTERLGNLMLVGCLAWMSVGIWVMSKMIAFKH